MPTGVPCQPEILPMGSWPKLIEVTMPYNDTCASRRGTADLLRWSMGAEAHYGYEFADYQPPRAPGSTGFSVSRLMKRLCLAAAASLRLLSRVLYLRCRALNLRSYPPPSP